MIGIELKWKLRLFQLTLMPARILKGEEEHEEWEEVKKNLLFLFISSTYFE